MFLDIYIYYSDSLSILPGSTIPSWILLEMQILGPQPRPSESDILGWGTAICGLTRPSGNSDVCSNLRTTELTDGLKRHLGRKHWPQMPTDQ